MNTLTKTKKDVEQLSESVINEEWESWDEYCDDYYDDYIEDLTKKYDDFISSELNYYYKFL